MAISENWAYLLEPGLREVFYVQRDALAAESKIPLLFNTITSTKAIASQNVVLSNRVVPAYFLAEPAAVP